MTNATHHYNRRTCWIHCRGKHASEDHHLSLAVPPLPTLPTNTTLHQHNPMPGPSTLTQRHTGTLTTSTCCHHHNPPKTKKKQHHLASQCNRCINGQQCDATEDTHNRYDGFDDDDHYDYDDVAKHNLC